MCKLGSVTLDANTINSKGIAAEGLVRLVLIQCVCLGRTW